MRRDCAQGHIAEVKVLEFSDIGQMTYYFKENITGYPLCIRHSWNKGQIFLNSVNRFLGPSFLGSGLMFRQPFPKWQQSQHSSLQNYYPY